MPPRRPVLRFAVAGVLTLATASSVLVAEAAWTRSRHYLPASSAPVLTGTSGPPAGDRVTLVLLGDSTAVGVGATTTATSVAGRLAAALAAAGHRVTLRSVAAAGGRARDLRGQVDGALAAGGSGAGGIAVVAVILVGANDVTHLTATGAVRRDLAGAVRRLRAAGLAVVVGTCPDLGGARAFPVPLRQLAAWRGRAVARAEAAAVRAAGGVPVDLGALTGPAFRADPRSLSSDRFHPSDRGYALWAAALRPAVLRAAGGARVGAVGPAAVSRSITDG